MNVVMLHSVGNNNSGWYQNWLSVSLNHFELFCKFLKHNNYESLYLNDWYYLQNNPALIHKKQIILTFDDGYLDNWVFVYPLLSKYDLKGTIFINPEFIDPSMKKRPTLEDVWKEKLAIDELKSLGFLNWEEIKYMDKSDTIDIQSHSMSHNYYFKSDKIIDYYQGQDEYHWLAWVKKPDRKPFWITENQKVFVPNGYPVFEYDRALGIRRLLLSSQFEKSFISKYNEYKYDNHQNIKKYLIKYVEEYKNLYDSIGRYENNDELEQRYRYEIFESKRIIEGKLNKIIEFFCWPGGGYNDLSIQLSIEAGYKASTIASWENQRIINNLGTYKRIRRCGLGSFSMYNGKYKYNINSDHLIHSFLSKSGNSYYKNLMRIKEYYHRIIELVKY
jgi:peptidoglycan/xylan/chitin deacetylase (PgdA/CDA1 family)